MAEGVQLLALDFAAGLESGGALSLALIADVLPLASRRARAASRSTRACHGLAPRWRRARARAGRAADRPRLGRVAANAARARARRADIGWRQSGADSDVGARRDRAAPLIAHACHAPARDSSAVYAASISARNFRSTVRRFTLSVGVSSPLSIVKSCSSSTTFFGLLEVRELAEPAEDLLLHLRLHERIREELAAVGRRDVLVPRPLLELIEVRHHENHRELAPVADHHRLRHVLVRLHLILDRLRRDVLAAGGHDDVLLAIGDAQQPSSSVPMSPVWNQPSASIASAVASGWLR